MRFSRTAALAFLSALACSGSLMAQEPSFRFVTQSLPAGTRNAVYTAQLLTAHAKGPVAFGLASGTLPGGLLLDTTTGLLTGRPTEASNFNLTFSAADGQSTLQLPITLQISSSGGGGNGAFTFDTLALAEGRVGTAYSATLLTSGGVGPFVYGAAHLPPGLHFDGSTGTISGTPRAAGTFEVLLCAVDRGEADNKVATILPLVVRPFASELRFAAQTLDNGAMGASYECTPVLLDAPGSLEFSAVGLPAGLSIDTGTGSISGTPTEAGTFEAELRVRGSGDEIAWNSRIRIVPSTSSSLHWNDFALPIAMASIPYGRQPSILLDASGATSPTYGAVGLPSGITYSSSTGELAGTAHVVGIHPVTFTMTNAPGGEVLVLRTTFAVLPSTGGSVDEIAAPIWVSKLQVKAGSGNADGSWKASLLMNSDRRDSVRFDGAEDELELALGSETVLVPSGAFAAQGWKHAYSFRDAGIGIQVGYDLASERLDLSASGISWADALPGTLDLRVRIGEQSRLLRLQLDERGRFRATGDLRSAAFVLTRASLSRDDAGTGDLALDGLLGDAAFTFDPASEQLRVKVLHEGIVLLDRELSSGATVKSKVDSRTGNTLVQIAVAREEAGPNACTGMRYDSAKGKWRCGFQQVNLSALPAGPTPVHLSLEVAFGTRVFTAAATFFEQSPGNMALRAR